MPEPVPFTGPRGSRPPGTPPQSAEPAESHTANDTPLTQLFNTLGDNIAELVRKEIQLARAEMTEKALDASTDAALVAAGGALAYAVLPAILSSTIDLFSKIFPRWFATLVVGGTTLGAGAFLALAGISRLRQTDWVPRQTIESVRENAETIKQHVG